MKEKIKAELKKVKSLENKGEKWQYFKDYYLRPLIVLVVIVGVIVAIVLSAINNNYKDALGIIVLQGDIINEEGAKKVLNEELEIDGKNERVSIYNGYMLYTHDSTDVETFDAINVLFYADKIDVFIGSDRAVDYYAKNNYFVDLSEKLDSKTLEKLKADDKLYYYVQTVTNANNEVYILSKPVGIYIDDSDFDQKANIVLEDKAIICFNTNSLKKENVDKVIDYVLKDYK